MPTIEVSVRGAVRHVVLNRAEKRNALDPEMLAVLTATFRETPQPDERVAVISAAGSVFCAGIDLRNRDASATGARHIEALLHAVESWPLPVVAIVGGDAVAGGCELALHCDLIVAAASARFGMSLAQIGLAPSWFLTKKLVEIAGPAVTRQMLLLGDPLPATRLFELGIISHLAPLDELDACAGAVVGRIVANAPRSLKAIKAVLQRGQSFRDAIAHDDLDRLVGDVRISPDAHEGMAARLERRPPRFTGQ
jgi:enoyl-CoA hydratase/carnithine racemase